MRAAAEGSEGMFSREGLTLTAHDAFARLPPISCALPSVRREPACGLRAPPEGQSMQTGESSGPNVRLVHQSPLSAAALPGRV